MSTEVATQQPQVVNPTEANSTATTATASTNAPQQAQPQVAVVPVTTQPPTTTSANAASFSSASLYVGDLKPDVSESQLFEVFKQCGTVASIRVCRDAITRSSLGYAYINFHNAADAQRALDTLNFSSINEKPCRIMWSHRDPASRKSGLGNIYIKGLAKAVNNQQLNDTFAQFGHILSCKVETEDNGESKGFGYVHFEEEKSAKAAIEQVNGKQIADKVVFVGPFQSRRERAQATGGKEIAYTNVYIKNLEQSVTEEQLKELFKSYGTITSIFIAKENALSRGFGFINFEDHEAAKKAVEEMNGKNINGKQLYVGRAQKKYERERELKNQFARMKAENAAKHQGSNLYVRNLEDSINDDELRNLFSPFGTITSAKVMRDDRQISRGFGFVCFSSQEEATKALSEMNGSIVHQKPLYVAMAQKKEQRREQLRALHRGPFPYQTPAPMMYPFGGMFPPRQMMPQGYAPQQMMRWQQSRPARMNYQMYPQQGGQQISQGMPMQQQMATGYGQRQQRMPNIVRRAQGAPVQMQRGPRRQFPVQQGAVPMVMDPHLVAQQQVQLAAVQQQIVQPQQVAVEQQLASGALPKEEFDQLANQGADELKQALGERLFTHVMEHYPQQQKCGKITGMLLESMDLHDLNTLLDDSVALKSKIDEANNVYEEHQRKQETVATESPANN